MRHNWLFPTRSLVLTVFFSARDQVLSVTDIEAEDQTLFAGDSSAPITNDDGLKAALRTTGGGLYGNYPVIRVTKRVRDDAGLARKVGISTETSKEDRCLNRNTRGQRYSMFLSSSVAVRAESLIG